MRSNFLKHCCLKTLIALLFFIAITISPDSYAIYDGVRDDITFDTDSNKCDTGSIAFSPFSNNNDIEWVFSNPSCIGFISGVGAIMLADEYVTKKLCTALNTAGMMQKPAEEIEDIAPPPPSPTLTPSTPTKAAKLVGRCATRVGEYIGWQTQCATSLGANVIACGQSPIAASDAARCCGALASYTAALGAAVAALSTTWGVAKDAYAHAQICGADWNSWAQEVRDDGQTVWMKGKGPYQKCISSLFAGGTLDSNCSKYGITGTADEKASRITNKYFREYIYGGMEYEDNSCTNPVSWLSDTRMKILGYGSDNQRYYMVGPSATPSYACSRFLLSGRTNPDAVKSYDCCRQRSQKAICIESRGEYNFCEIGQKCKVSGFRVFDSSPTSITFDIYESRKQINYVCAKTYSVCPYDHLLGGGTEIRKYKTTDTSQVENFCQFMNHCSKIPVLPNVRMSSLTGAYIASACRDMKGDSQNSYSYTSALLPINNRGFSAPMVQCFKETMENIFLNIAGTTVCSDPDEFPNNRDECESGNYTYRKGYDIQAYGVPGKSFFIKIQDNLRDSIKLVLTLSIMFYGVKTLFAQGQLAKKELLHYLMKIGIIFYFALGTGWQSGFVQGILGMSSFLSSVTFQLDESGDDSKLDGCQFPRFDYADDNETTKYASPRYPDGKDYLKALDTIDCKIARALGFGPEVSVPNLIVMILGGLFTGGFGLVFVVGAFFFAFFLIAIVVRGMHVLLVSITATVILLYVSPLTITCWLFDKTKGIFNGWAKQLLGFALQPMILFLYFAILISFFDKIVIGDATFAGTSDDPKGRKNPKQIVCNGDANDNSIYCIFRISQMKTYTGLEVLGIGVPVLTSLNENKINTIIKSAILMFIFLSFMDQVAKLAADLVGGGDLGGWKISAVKMANSSFGVARGIQRRGTRVASKLIKRGGAKAYGAAKGIAKEVGKGKTGDSAAKRDSGAGAKSSKAGNLVDDVAHTIRTGPSIDDINNLF